MATWKKVVVSGSNAELNSLKISSGSLRVTNLSGSEQSYVVFYDTASGEFTYAGTGSFTATSASIAETASLALKTTGSLVSSIGIRLADISGSNTGSFNGSTNVTIAISGAAELSDKNFTAWDAVAGKFINTGLVVTGSATTASLVNSGSVNLSIQLLGTSSSLTGSFSGSFVGDGSQLTGLASILRISGSTANDTGSLNLLTQALIITGSANGILATITSGSQGVSASLSLSPNLVVTNLTVDNDLLVKGTASFQNTENLLVKDRFILLASGSTTAGDGGLIIQQGTQNVGEVFAFDSGATRWAVTSSFNAASSSFTPDAFMAAVVTASLSASVPNTPTRYQAAGNIFIGTDDESIWIYS
jgi:hypothetical protein